MTEIGTMPAAGSRPGCGTAVADEVLLARAYLSRVAEPPAAGRRPARRAGGSGAGGRAGPHR